LRRALRGGREKLLCRNGGPNFHGLYRPSIGHYNVF